MAEELQGLLNRIQTEGIEKAEAEKAEIIGNAKAEAAKIIEKAKEEAASIVKKANEEAEISVSKGNAAIRQAARDVLIALRADIEARLKSLVTESIGKAMTPDVMGKIILESGCFVLPSLGNRAIHKVFSNLFLAANNACVDISSAGLCKIEFCFWLYQEVPANKAT